jgi:hypothetical protein
MDNITTDESQVVDTQAVDAQQIQTTESTLSQGQDTVSIPEKFLVNGEPDYNKLAQSYLELEKRIGTKVPVTDANEYDFKFEAEDRWDIEQFQEFKNTASELGLSKDQFNTAMKIYEQNMNAVIDSFTETPEKCSAQLQQEWGNDYEPNLKLAYNAFQTFAPQGLNIDEIGNNPTMIKLLASIGQQIGEDRGLNTQAAVKGSGLSPLEIQEYMARPDYYTNREVQKIVSEWYASGNKL